MNILKGILLKLLSALMFAVMQALVRLLGENVPLGQVVFFRAAFAVVPVVVIYALRNELRTAAHTERPFGQIGRGLVGAAGMFCNFGALARLPLAEVTAISFASPLATVALAALSSRSACGSTAGPRWRSGFSESSSCWARTSIPRRFASHTSTQLIGASFALTGAFTNAAAVIQTRRLTDTETTSSIVLYFSLVCSAAGLATLPFGWIMPSPFELAVLVSIGPARRHRALILTESYRLPRPRSSHRSTTRRSSSPSCSAMRCSARCRPAWWWSARSSWWRPACSCCGASASSASSGHAMRRDRRPVRESQSEKREDGHMLIDASDWRRLRWWSCPVRHAPRASSWCATSRTRWL